MNHKHDKYCDLNECLKNTQTLEIQKDINDLMNLISDNMKMMASPIFMIANNAVMKHEDTNETYRFIILVTPYRRYLRVPSNNNLFFKSLKPQYVIKNKGFSTNLAYLYEMSIEVWKVLDNIRSAIVI